MSEETKPTEPQAFDASALDDAALTAEYSAHPQPRSGAVRRYRPGRHRRHGAE